MVSQTSNESAPVPESAPQGEKKTGFAHLVQATGYSLKGLRVAWGETAFRQELGFAVVLIPLAFVVGKTLVETALLIATLLIVLIAELVNSAIEVIVDRIGPERHELSGQAKDLGSAAVMIALILVPTVWTLVLLARLGF